MTRWLRLGVFATVVIVLSVPAYLLKKRLDGPAVTTEVAADFVGREQCVSCHEDAYQGWSRSDHDHAMDVATDSTVRGDFDDAVFVRDGMESRFYRREGRYWASPKVPTVR